MILYNLRNFFSKDLYKKLKKFYNMNRNLRLEIKQNILKSDFNSIENYRKNNLNLSDINMLIHLIPNLRGKAYVTFILSSGLTRSQALNLKVADMIPACFSQFFTTDEEDNLTSLLSSNPCKIIPMWRIKTSNGKKITFSSRESTYYLFLYLKERQLNNPISLDEPLFASKGRKLSQQQLNVIFNYFEKVKLFNCKSDDFSFSDATLRDYFILACERCLPSFIDNKKDLEKIVLSNKNNTKREKLCKLFTDGLSEDTKIYKEFTSNIDQLRKYYLYIEPFLSARNHYLENRIMPMKNIEYRLYDQYAFKEKYTQKELDEIIDNYLSKFSAYPDFDEDDQKIIKYLKAHVKEDNDTCIPTFTESYLDNLLIDSILESDIDCDNFFTKVNISKKSPRYTINQILIHLDNLKIFKKYQIDKELFEQYLVFYFKEIKEPNETYFTKKDIVRKLLDIKYLVFPYYFIETGQYDPNS